MSRLEQRMDADLNRIRDWVWDIGEDVETALLNAKKTLVLRDAELAYRTVLGDHPINRASRECDRLCHRFIARYLPGAGILREMASTIRVNVALERIGDYAVTMCREAMQLPDGLPDKFVARLDALADRSIDILRQARTTFREGNAESAVTLTRAAQRVETGMDALYEELFAEDPHMDGRTMMAIFVIFNMLKRVADQAKNISEQSIYAVRGIAKMPKVHRILFIDEPGSDLAQLAVAIGRKSFPETGVFVSAKTGGSSAPSEALRAFLEATGLPDEELQSESLEALTHDFSDFNVIIGLNGRVEEYLPSIPFHTTPLNWSVPEDVDLAEQYRELNGEVAALVTLIAGPEAN